MRRVVLIHLVAVLGLAFPARGRAQTATQAPGAPAAAVPQAPQAPEQAPAPAPDALPESSRSLFEPTWRQFAFGGRLSSVAGDPARFQRYGDLSDGVLFTDARYAREDPSGSWLFRASADNVGWRDQRYAVDYERTGRFVISGLWDEIPQFYSVDTRTPYTTSGGALVLDDATQNAIQGQQAGLSAYVPIAPQFDLRERRDIGNVRVLATPTPQLDVKAAFTTTRHTGELPWGASFGFGNDVEVALPYDSRTNDFTVGAEWTNNRTMFRVGYNGSWFDNLDDTLVWDSPLRLTDSTSAPGRGRMALWPSNSAQTVSAAGYARFARRTQLTGSVSYGLWNNDEPLQPFTITEALAQPALPRATAQAEAHVLSATVGLVSRPLPDWRFSGRVRQYSYDNQTGHVDIPEFINYDTSVKVSSTGGPEPYAHDRTNLDADVTWTGIQPLAVTVGYTRNNGGYDFRIFERTGENVFYVSVDAVGSQWVTFRAQYDVADRTGSGLNEDLLVEIGEQPQMRHYDVADRGRTRFTGQVDVTPNDVWLFSVSGGVGKDEFDETYFGLQESEFRVFSFAVDYRQPNGLGAGAGYNYERYTGLQRSRSADQSQAADPLRDWTADSAEVVDYVSIYATPPKIGRNTEARLSYDYSFAEGSYLYAVVPGGPLPSPTQLPNVYNKLQQLHVDVRHRLSARLAISGSYLYEPFRVYDFAFDQTVVDSIVQPSSLVLGYVYRPYTAHSGVLALRYYW
jgi:MtrB/PioB family decaheme-associated outer membrane protein